MKLILEVNKEKDLKMLLLLLERLNISYDTIDEAALEVVHDLEATTESGISFKKNYDEAAIQKVLFELRKNKVFASIENPSNWQNELRNE